MLHKRNREYVSNSTVCDGFLGFHQCLEKTPLTYFKIFFLKKSILEEFEMIFPESTI